MDSLLKFASMATTIISHYLLSTQMASSNEALQARAVSDKIEFERRMSLLAGKEETDTRFARTEEMIASICKRLDILETNPSNHNISAPHRLDSCQRKPEYFSIDGK
jgi:hypothetical protein